MIKSVMMAAGLAFAVLFGLMHPAEAGSDAKFPTGWDKWPTTSTGRFLSANTPIPADTKPIERERQKTYAWINNGTGSAYNIRINPAKSAAQKAGKGEYADGPTAVLELTDIKVILVTSHLVGQPLYGVYSYDGKDLSGAHPSLNPKVCTDCHSGFTDYCINGICSK